LDNFTLSVRSKRLKRGSIEGEAVTIPCSNKVQKRVTLSPHLFPIRDAHFSLAMKGELRLAGRGSICFFWRRIWNA
jgi:hypothetical protein